MVSLIRNSCKTYYSFAQNMFHKYKAFFAFASEPDDCRVAGVHEAEGREDVVRRLPGCDAHPQLQGKHSQRTSRRI